MNIIQQLRRIEEVFHIKRLEKVLFWSSSLFLFLISSVLRLCIPINVTYTQPQLSILWLIVACAIAFLINYQINLLQKRKVNWLKMMGLSNDTIFALALYDCRFNWMFILCVYSVINFFYIDLPLVLLCLSECIMYYYMFVIIYYGKVRRAYQKLSCSVMLWLKRIFIVLFLVSILFIIIMKDYICGILHIQDEVEELGKCYQIGMNVLRNPFIVAVITAIFLGIFGYCSYYIYQHELYDETDKKSRVPYKKNWFQDSMLRCKGKRWRQLIKINFILFTRNKNNSLAKAMLMLIWFAFVMLCENRRSCLIVGTLIIMFEATLILYRIQDDRPNLLLYESLGITLKNMFGIYYHSAMAYLFNKFTLIALVGNIRGNLTLLGTLGLMLWLTYQCIYFTSFNLYYIFIRKVNSESPFYEVFELFVGIVLGLTPFSILFPIFLFVNVRKQEHQYKELCGEEKTYDAYK